MSDSPDAGSAGVDVAGAADAPTIVLVHGSVFTRTMWAPQRNALTDEFRVVAPDLPGHGSRADRDFEMERAVGVVADAVRDYTDGDALLVGLSLGGYVATEYASRNPDAIAGLIVAGSSANPVGKLAHFTRAVGWLVRQLTRSERIEHALAGQVADYVRDTEIDEAEKGEILGSGFYPRQYGVAGAYLAGVDFREKFAAFPGPALVLNGEGDGLNRRGEDAHAEAAADARVEVLDGAGHVCNLDRPTRFTATVRGFHSSVAEPAEER